MSWLPNSIVKTRPRPKTPDKRTRLLQTAADLTHRQGFRGTTLATLARAAKVPLGNVYYYFKTKEEIAEAIVEQHATAFRALRSTWDELDSPRERLLRFVAMVHGNRERLARDGCPLGSLCSELNKEGGEIARNASTLLSEPLAWLEAQFRALGKGRESAELALHMYSALEGVSLLANTLDDPALVVTETRRVERWLREL